MACTATASQSVRNVLEMTGCVQVTTSDLRPTVRLGLSSDTVLDGILIVAPINVVTALIDRQARSLPAFSRDLILVIHLEQTNDD